MLKQALMFAAVFSCLPAWAQSGAPAPGRCPQPRFTAKAPQEIHDRVNPLAKDPQAVQEGERLFRGKPGALSCVTCHGEKGDGKGVMAVQFSPPPRDFTCAQTISGVADGQLFWIVRNGSPGTSMPPVNAVVKVSDEQVWQLVSYLRSLARP